MNNKKTDGKKYVVVCSETGRYYYDAIFTTQEIYTSKKVADGVARALQQVSTNIAEAKVVEIPADGRYLVVATHYGSFELCSPASTSEQSDAIRADFHKENHNKTDGIYSYVVLLI